MSRKKSSKTNHLGIKGMGAIDFVKSINKYRGRVKIGTYDNGQVKYKSVTGETVEEVLGKMTEIKYAVMSGAFIQTPSKVTIQQIGDELNQEDLDLGLIKESSYFRRNETLRMLYPLTEFEVQNITTEDINQFFKKKVTYSKSVLSKIFQMLKRILDSAVKREIIGSNPMKYLKQPNSKKESEKIRAMTVEEQKNFISALEKSPCLHKEQMYISMLTGMRMGEVNALEVRDVDFRDNVIRIRKTVSNDQNGRTIIGKTPKTKAGRREIRMNEKVRDILKKCVGNKKEGLLFKTTKNNIVATDTVTTIFRNIIKQNNIQDDKLDGKLTLHSLRHTYATRCIEAGMPVKVLQKILGHTDIKVTMNTYCDAFETYTNDHLDIADNYFQSLGII